MAKLSTKSVLFALTVTGALLPTAALAGPAATSADAPAEMWDVVAPRATAKPVLSHVDVQRGSGFDAHTTVAAKDIYIVTRADFAQGRGNTAIAATEMWDAVPAPSARKTLAPSHIDIQPSTSFDYPATHAPKPTARYAASHAGAPDA